MKVYIIFPFHCFVFSETLYENKMTILQKMHTLAWNFIYKSKPVPSIKSVQYEIGWKNVYTATSTSVRIT